MPDLVLYGLVGLRAVLLIGVLFCLIEYGVQWFPKEPRSWRIKESLVWAAFVAALAVSMGWLD